LTGKVPFDGPNVGALLNKVQEGGFAPPREVKRTIAPPLEAVCLKAMALKPEERYPSPRELAEDIERWLAEEPVTAYPEPWTIRVSRWGKRHRALVASLAALVGTALIGGVLGAGLLAQAHARTKGEREAAEQNERKAQKAEANKRLLTRHHRATARPA